MPESLGDHSLRFRLFPRHVVETGRLWTIHRSRAASTPTIRPIIKCAYVAPATVVKPTGGKDCPNAKSEVHPPACAGSGRSGGRPRPTELSNALSRRITKPKLDAPALRGRYRRCAETCRRAGRTQRAPHLVAGNPRLDSHERRLCSLITELSLGPRCTIFDLRTAARLCQSSRVCSQCLMLISSKPSTPMQLEGSEKPLSGGP